MVVWYLYFMNFLSDLFGQKFFTNTSSRLLCWGRTQTKWAIFWTFLTPSPFISGSAELGGPGGPRPPHLFGIYLVKISKIRKFCQNFFFYLVVPLHKKFASAHPVSKSRNIKIIFVANRNFYGFPFFAGYL